MLPEPNNRDPLKTPSAAIESAVTVLERMVAEGMITVDQAARAENELKRRIKTGKLRRGNQTYTRLEYRAYRDLAMREARANGIKLPADYRLIVFLDPEFQRTLQAQICSITGTYQGAGFFMRPVRRGAGARRLLHLHGRVEPRHRHCPLDRIDRKALSADRRA